MPDGSSDQNCFDHHAFYVGYVTIVFYRAIKVVKQVWRLAPRKFFTIKFPTMPENTPLQTSLNSFYL